MEANLSHAKRRTWFFYGVFGVVLLLFIYQNAAWLVKYRFGQSLDIDESGYLTLAVAYAKAKMNGGWIGWLHAVAAPLGFAPLVPIITSVLMVFFGVNENLGFLCSIGFSAMTLVLMFAGLRRTSPGYAVLGTLLLASLPVFVAFTHTVQFVSATTFFFFAAFIFFVLSNELRRLPFALLAGASLGCLVLSRTMTLAFLPGFLFCFLLHLYLERAFTRQAVKNLLLSVLAFVVVAVPWYAKNFKSVFGYLFSFGYGAHAAEYGRSHGMFTLANLFSRLDMIDSDVRPIHFVLVVCAFLLFLIPAVITKKRHRTRSLYLSGALLVLFCFVVLSTTQNTGTGFQAPLYPVMIFCVVAWLASAGWYWLKAAYAACAIALFAVASYGNQDLARCQKMPTALTEGRFGYAPLLNCGSGIESYLSASGILTNPPPHYVWGRDDAIKWRDIARDLAAYLVKEDVSRRPVLLLSRHVLDNTNALGLEMIKQSGMILPMVQIDPAVLPASVSSYSQWLAQAPQSDACFAVMLDDQRGEFYPRADGPMMNASLSASHYTRVFNLATPLAGQHFWVWKKEAPECGAPTNPARAQ
jgi:hypothetical protein